MNFLDNCSLADVQKMQPVCNSFLDKIWEIMEAGVAWCIGYEDSILPFEEENLLGIRSWKIAGDLVVVKYNYESCDGDLMYDCSACFRAEWLFMPKHKYQEASKERMKQFEEPEDNEEYEEYLRLKEKYGG
jgi:hypothetical protein